MNQSSEVSNVLNRKLDWINKLKREPVVSQKISNNLLDDITNQQAVELIRIKYNVHTFNETLNFLNPNRKETFTNPKIKEYQEKIDKENQANDDRNEILINHDLFLDNENNANFTSLYLLHKLDFDRLYELGRKYRKLEADMKDTDRESFHQDQTIDNNNARKKSLASNIYFHLHNDSKNNRSSMFIVMFPLGISIMLLGVLVLHLAIYTFLWPVPIALIAFGAILTVTAITLAHIDQQREVTISKSLEASMESLKIKKEDQNKSLLEIWEEVEAIKFEPTNSIIGVNPKF